MAKKRKDKRDGSVEYLYYIDTDFSEYEGEWIAIKGREVVGHNRLIKKVFDEVEKKGIDKPLYAKVFPKDAIIVMRC